MRIYPQVVRVEFPAGGESLTCQTEPKITINPLGPPENILPGRCPVTFKVDPDSEESIPRQIIKAINPEPGRSTLERVIFDLRSIRNVLYMLGLLGSDRVKIVGAGKGCDYKFFDRPTETWKASLLCDLVTEIYGVDVGRKQRELLDQQPPTTSTQPPMTSALEILAHGPIITVGDNFPHLLILMATAGGFTVANQYHPPIGREKPFLDNSELFSDFVVAFGRFTNRLQEQLFKSFLDRKQATGGQARLINFNYPYHKEIVMRNFPQVVRVEFPVGQLTHRTSPKITINPIDPLENIAPGGSFTFRVNPDLDLPVAQQVLNAISPDKQVMLIRRIFDLRCIKAIMYTLGLSHVLGYPKIGGSDYNFVEKAITPEEIEAVPLLCDLVTDIYGSEVGNKQRELLKPPAEPKATETPDTILAHGPTITEKVAICPHRLVLVTSQNGFAVANQWFPGDGHKEFVGDAERFSDFLLAYARFAYLLQDQCLMATLKKQADIRFIL